MGLGWRDTLPAVPSCLLPHPSSAALVLSSCLRRWVAGTAACVVPVYISEVAPYASRGGLAYLFQARSLFVSCRRDAVCCVTPAVV